MPSLTVNTFVKHVNSKQIKENPGKVYSLYYELTRTEKCLRRKNDTLSCVLILPLAPKRSNGPEIRSF